MRRAVKEGDVRKTVELLDKCTAIDVALSQQSTYTLFSQGVCRNQITVVRTVICEIFVAKNFFVLQNFLCKNGLSILTYTVNIWCMFDVDENSVSRKFLTKFCKRN